jgi:hypothetical protein
LNDQDYGNPSTSITPDIFKNISKWGDSEPVDQQLVVMGS